MPSRLSHPELPRLPAPTEDMKSDECKEGESEPRLGASSCSCQLRLFLVSFLRGGEGWRIACSCAFKYAVCFIRNSPSRTIPRTCRKYHPMCMLSDNNKPYRLAVEVSWGRQQAVRRGRRELLRT
eukprot:747532-Hanusia_phi.AAC.2